MFWIVVTNTRNQTLQHRDPNMSGHFVRISFKRVVENDMMRGSAEHHTILGNEFKNSIRNGHEYESLFIMTKFSKILGALLGLHAVNKHMDTWK